MKLGQIAPPKRLPWFRPNSQQNARNDEAREESYYRASQWQLVWRKFKRHRLARLAIVVLALLYFTAAFAEFLSPHDPQHRYTTRGQAPPMAVRFYEKSTGLHGPFVYDFERKRDQVTARLMYTPDPAQKHRIRFLVPSDPYKMWGLFASDLHLFGSDVPVFLMGTDPLGRDLFSRILYGSRISLTVGLIGVGLSLVLGLVLGGISGYFGGASDEIIQRLVDLLIALPTIPLWMALAAALPQDWPQTRTYFAITIILSVLGWTTLARVVRGKILSLREEDFTLAARLDGESEWRIITRYLLPSFTSYIIVSLTMAIPLMILGETALSFLGIGLRPPTISWGVLLQDAQDIQAVAQYPWALWPTAFVVLAVLMFNFLGDGLRDAADPYVT